MRAVYIGVSALCTTVLLASCQSSKELAAADDAKCQSYGLKMGTGEYAECRHAQEVERRRRYEADRRASIQRTDAMAAANQRSIGAPGSIGMQHSAFPTPAPANVVTATSTTSSSTGTGSCSQQTSGRTTTINCNRSSQGNSSSTSFSSSSR